MSSRDIQKLAQQLASLKTQLRASMRPQLSDSSIENGSLVEYYDTGDDDGAGTLGTVIGTQFDGTHAAISVTGPTPPMPTGITVEAGTQSVRVSWDGSFLDGAFAPADFLLIQVGLVTDEDEDPRFDPIARAPIGSVSGGTIGIPATQAVEVYVRCYSVTQSGKQSAITPAIPVTPDTVASQVIEGARIFYNDAGSPPVGARAGEIWFQETDPDVWKQFKLNGDLVTWDQMYDDGAEAAADLAVAASAAAGAASSTASSAAGVAASAASAATAAASAASVADGKAVTADGKAVAAQSTADAKTMTFSAGSAPSSPVDGYLWFDTTTAGDVKFKRWNGTSWVAWVLGDSSISLTDLSLAGDLTVGDDATINDALTVYGAANIYGATRARGTLQADGPTQLPTTTVNGLLTLLDGLRASGLVVLDQVAFQQGPSWRADLGANVTFAAAATTTVLATPGGTYSSTTTAGKMRVDFCADIDLSNATSGTLTFQLEVNGVNDPSAMVVLASSDGVNPRMTLSRSWLIDKLATDTMILVKATVAAASGLIGKVTIAAANTSLSVTPCPSAAVPLFASGTTTVHVT